jgi:transcriptional regulator with PAS, ATPase and Fis domain
MIHWLFAVRKGVMMDNREEKKISLWDVFHSDDEKTKIFKEILNTINSLILIADTDTKVCYVNDTFLRVYGTKPEDIVGKKLKHSLKLPEVIKDGKKLNFSYLDNAKIGCVADLSQLILDGKVIGGITNGRDVTNIRKLNSEIQRYENANKKLKKLVSQAYEARYSFEDIIGNSKVMQEAIKFASKAAKGDSNILITGESGTGKEMVAQAIHNGSNRSEGKFVAVNCAAIVPSLIESELFGYEEGAFTGAKKGGKIGLFEIANGGTIFLDEIGELGLEVQAKLLRVLQERAVRMVGSVNVNDIDVRVIAATNKDLKEKIREGLFREDLYYRLNVINVNLPTLQQRRCDIQLLAKEFLKEKSLQYSKAFEYDDETLDALLQYNWPGNIRELRNAVEYAVNMCDDDNRITINNLPLWLQPQNKRQTSGKLSELTKEFERHTIESYLKKYGTTVTAKKKIAAELGISIATLYNKLREYGYVDEATIIFNDESQGIIK